MRKHEYGFTLIEFIVILALCTTIIGLSLNGYSNFSKKNQKKSSTSLANKVYYHLITYINYARNFYTKKIDGVTYIVTYPFYAQSPSKTGEHIDDFDYSLFCNLFLNDVFLNCENLSGGTYLYNPVEYVAYTKRSVENEISYLINDTKFIFNVLMTDGTYTSYDTLHILSMTYIDKFNNKITFNI